MGQIVTLDQNMINMIAAGEVIERPASVVKELVENSIDAGATRITVSIEDGGRKLISVADNGCGMDGEDLAHAFESHATSKIRTSKDLRGISTLGFRGEALASIASVGQVRAMSRTKDAQEGNCTEIDCGNKGTVTPCSADYGTTIQVRNLFYKLPARRKFLKTANTEGGHITEHFTRIALANCDLDMTLTHNDREVHRLGARQGVRQRIAELFSPEVCEDLIAAGSSEKGRGGGVHISAFMGKPSISRTSGKFQYIFLNGRFIRDKFISHAIKEAYRGCLEPGRFPVVFLFIQMPHEDYDVNVHPTKIEVRFYNANLIHSQVLGCLRETLLATNLQAEVKFGAGTDSKTAEKATGEGHYRSEKIADAMTDFFKKHRPVHTQQHLGFQKASDRKSSVKGAGEKAQTAESPALPQLPREFLQIHDSFIVIEAEDGFAVVDQHALHERIIYENIRRRIQTSKLESQKLLIPESFQLTDAQADAVDANAELMERLGIELVSFGPRSMAIQAFPSLLAKAAPVDFVQDLVDLLSEKSIGLDTESLLEEVLNMAACKAAIKAGQKLSDSEIKQLLADKEKTEYSSHCPHGRPTTIKFSISELEKQFKRT
ncbi:MAG: DNA mismatch repair endonuclease MutL [Planctomycetota bacterium]|nr:MAG: DNA mismatch repair endonuclease MutL [Planctomycetota bacterium]